MFAKIIIMTMVLVIVYSVILNVLHATILVLNVYHVKEIIEKNGPNQIAIASNLFYYLKI